MTDSNSSIPLLETRSLSVRAGTRPVLRELNLCIRAGDAIAVVGPSGAGKSTLLKCLNRLVDLTPSLSVLGEVLFHGVSTRAPNTDVDQLRSRIGMLFQQPVVFPATIRANVLFGVRHLRQQPRERWPEIAEQSLRSASLWNEVKDRLDESALKLSLGQQQRLCLARTLAVNPEVILLDEPTSALDPRSTEVVESSLLALKRVRTLVFVTHNLSQAERLSDRILRLAPAE